MLMGCGQAPQPTRAPQTPVERGLEYLAHQQQPDGSWRSQVYRDMAGGYELTPMIAKALLFSGRREAAARGLAFMETALDGKNKLTYPVYTASVMLMALGPGERTRPWQAFVRRYQLGKENGYSSKDADYGGWGYALEPPRAGSGEHSNLTSTTFAVGGLRYSGVPADDPAVRAALSFVRRCQTRDGGFCAAPEDPVLNKAGPGVAYGSASADGLRAFLRCGLSKSDPEVVRGRDWLVGHLDSERCSGAFPAVRYEDRDSLYFYYLWSASHALAAMQRGGLGSPGKAFGVRLRERLAGLQQPDGSFRNRMGGLREDDPLVATPFALAAWQLSERF